MTETALLIVDVQIGMFGFPDMQPYQGESVIENINALITRARQQNAAVIFVQHDGGEGHPLDAKIEGHAIDPRLNKRETDPVIVKQHCVAFRNTALESTLETLGVKQLIITGIQTDYCVDSAVRIAVDKGYEVTIASGAHTTFDTEYMGAKDIITHHETIWTNNFGTVKPAKTVTFAKGRA